MSRLPNVDGIHAVNSAVALEILAIAASHSKTLQGARLLANLYLEIYEAVRERTPIPMEPAEPQSGEEQPDEVPEEDN